MTTSRRQDPLSMKLLSLVVGRRTVTLLGQCRQSSPDRCGRMTPCRTDNAVTPLALGHDTDLTMPVLVESTRVQDGSRCGFVTRPLLLDVL